MNNKSPLRYPGGKTRACQILDNILLEHFNLSTLRKLVSPFFGGGSFEFYLQNNYNLDIVANDKFKPLHSFWTSCKFQNKELCQELYQKIDNVTKSDFLELRKNIMSQEDSLKQSIMYFIINRCSFSGATLSGGFSMESSKKRFTKSSIDRIDKLNLSNFEIYNYDFEEFIDKYWDKDTSIMFLDPPYYLENSNLYGNNGDMHENFNHEKLYECLKTKCNWIMTYNNCDYIKKMYKDYHMVETTWSYGMNKSKKSSEIVIIGNKYN